MRETHRLMTKPCWSERYRLSIILTEVRKEGYRCKSNLSVYHYKDRAWLHSIEDVEKYVFYYKEKNYAPSQFYYEGDINLIESIFAKAGFMIAMHSISLDQRNKWFSIIDMKRFRIESFM
jgi:hypothetical protein